MEPVYEVHGLCKYYGKKAALDGVDFTVEPGKLVGLLGPNGSGKTTLIKISAGLLTADSFSLTGVNIQDVPLLLLFFLLILALIAGAQLHAYLACAYAGMFTQHRLTISIISYFVIGFIGQMLSLVGTIVFAIKVYPFLDNIGSMVELQNSILLSICVIFLLTLLVDALLWALTQWLMSSRLNLA